MAKFNDLWDGSIDQRKVHCLVPFFDQDGYRAQVPQDPIDSYNIYVVRKRAIPVKILSLAAISDCQGL